ncbi:MipA/OmpV family protein [Exilibacterium tricleocarpae]|uniref:MipA/OmpV family protein n=1 Tax=Exilibacterium tricleocarpae TaxID=2591008 RepID=A0A545T6A1_9GAMM|nr:MipA/OmpV family protein [Exilibacterium tricleocarpae]TQV72692.1 MipA/OmpV family protein [Exilibacterium tricleocarpae]
MIKQSRGALTHCLPYLIPLFGVMGVDAVRAAGEKPPSDSFIIFGPGSTPEYMGSDDYNIIPMLISSFSIAEVDVEIEGLTARMAFLDRGGWRFGTALNIDMGREDDVDNAVVAAMEEIDTALNVGAFLAYGQEDLFLADDSIEFSVEAYGDGSDVHDGAFTTLGLSYTLPLYIPWRFEFELETTYASTQYMDTYFGVGQADSFASGLVPYAAESSFRDITFSTNIGLFFNPTWGVFTRLSASRLLGDAADSPITDIGDDDQYFIGLGLYYRF